MLIMLACLSGRTRMSARRNDENIRVKQMTVKNERPKSVLTCLCAVPMPACAMLVQLLWSASFSCSTLCIRLAHSIE